MTPAPLPEGWLPELRPSPAPDTPSGADTGRWAGDRGPAPARAARTVGRVVLWALAALVLVAGLRQIVFPPARHATGHQRSTTPGWPAGAAESVAARFAVDYLTFDEDDPTAWAQSLAVDVPSGVDLSAGWDGHGRQAVVQAVAGGPERQGASRAVVDVQVRVLPYTGAGRGRWRALPPVWQTLQVPVGLVSGRVVITGAPAYVGRSRPPAPPTVDPPEVDTAVSERTRSQAERFFTAYGNGGDTTAYTTPGAAVTGLDGRVSFVELDTWSVHTGPKGVRDATAVVTWRDVTGAVLTQDYRLRLVRIAAMGGSRWFVEQVGAETGALR